MTLSPQEATSCDQVDQPRNEFTVAMIGNPNVGKTALFNRLTGLRAKTANYPGITVDLRRGKARLGDDSVVMVDLPGLYSLDSLSPEEKVAEEALSGDLIAVGGPDLVLVVVDATNIERNLFLVSEVLDLQRPVVVAVNMIDAANSAGAVLDLQRLSAELKCPVIPVSARTGEGLDTLRQTMGDLLQQKQTAASDHTSCTMGCTGCVIAARYEWAELVVRDSVQSHGKPDSTTETLDSILTNPVIGVVAFLVVMLAVFYLIFSLAGLPMSLIENSFAAAGSFVESSIPAEISNPWLWGSGVFAGAMLVFALCYYLSKVKWGYISTPVAVAGSLLVAVLPVDDFRSLMVDGIVGGIGGVVIFLPQICILFFFISLLEGSGYMARAAFVMERLMRFVGLPGKAFVPMLSAHACAIPGIMAARVIENWRDRLVTILVLPLLTCSARLPVYAMVAALLFGDSPALAAVVFLGAYVLGIVAALGAAFVLKKSILQGESVAMVLELPPYRLPGLRDALLTVYDRALVFLRKAGTVILAISVILWVLITYPKIDEKHLPPEATAQLQQLRKQSHAAELKGDEELSGELETQASNLLAQQRLAYSFAGRMGRATEPVFDPLGFDWKINVGVISSFAAREVIVSTLAIVYGVGEDSEDGVLLEKLKVQKRASGAPVFDVPTCLSLLVFYVLAMQCLPTQVVTRRETGSWKWAALQFGYMTLLAYVAALCTYHLAALFV